MNNLRKKCKFIPVIKMLNSNGINNKSVKYFSPKYNKYYYIKEKL